MEQKSLAIIQRNNSIWTWTCRQNLIVFVPAEWEQNGRMEFELNFYTPLHLKCHTVWLRVLSTTAERLFTVSLHGLKCTHLALLNSELTEMQIRHMENSFKMWQEPYEWLVTLHQKHQKLRCHVWVVSAEHLYLVKITSPDTLRGCFCMWYCVDMGGGNSLWQPDMFWQKWKKKPNWK